MIDTRRAAQNVNMWRRFRSHSRTFSLAALLLPRPVRMPVALVYLLCRRIDEIADELVFAHGVDAALTELDHLEETLLDVADGGTADGWLWPRLAETIRAYELDPAPYIELIDGARWDLEERPIESFQDLVEYSDLVGGSIGAVMLPFLVPDGGHRTGLQCPARALGIAMQITNILRDVGEDWSLRQRVYLPTDMLAEAGLSVEELVAGPEIPSAYVDVIEQLMEAAEVRFSESREYIGALPWRASITTKAAARMYREILNEIRRNGYDNLHRRAVVPARRKLLSLAESTYSARRNRLRLDMLPSA